MIVMRHHSSKSTIRNRMIGLTEISVGIAAVAILAVIVLPIIRSISQATTSRMKHNAQVTQQASSSLSTLNIAHVLPESLGGVEATTRLLKQGIYVSDGPMEGHFLGVPNLQENEVVPTSKFLNVVFDLSDLYLEYSPGRK
jgi:hypothetical protein